MITDLTFKIVLHSRHLFSALVTTSSRDQRKKRKKGKTMKQTQQPSCFSHLNKGTENARKQNTKAQNKNKSYKIIPTPCSPPPTHTIQTVPFLKQGRGREVNVKCLPKRGESEKLKKEVQGWCRVRSS